MQCCRCRQHGDASKRTQNHRWKKHTLHWLRSPESAAIFTQQSRLEKLGLSIQQNGMPNGTENSRNLQISGKSDNLEGLTKFFEMNFAKISVPFDSVPEFPEFLVEWKAPMACLAITCNHVTQQVSTTVLSPAPPNSPSLPPDQMTKNFNFKINC